jgi:hypothetical protein
MLPTDLTSRYTSNPVGLVCAPAPSLTTGVCRLTSHPTCSQRSVADPAESWLPPAIAKVSLVYSAQTIILMKQRNSLSNESQAII